ncbi:MAG: 50S ribosomal protein L7/L12 [Fimbriimonadia bacterium]|nr:50S ribosomal protein L7/L12 [Fimbriimonadia bacterium]
MATISMEQMIEAIDSMTVLELNDFVKALQDKYGVSAAAPVAMAMPGMPAGGGEVAAAEEKTSFDVVLTAAGDKRLDVIKTVREITQLGLKEAKDLVEGAPQPIVQGVAKEEAEKVKEKLVAAGATVDIK